MSLNLYIPIFIEQLDQKIKEKTLLYNAFRDLRNELIYNSFEYNENISRGLKSLRQTLCPPYFSGFPQGKCFNSMYHKNGCPLDSEECNDVTKMLSVYKPKFIIDYKLDELEHLSSIARQYLVEPYPRISQNAIIKKLNGIMDSESDSESVNDSSIGHFPVPSNSRLTARKYSSSKSIKMSKNYGMTSILGTKAVKPLKIDFGDGIVQISTVKELQKLVDKKRKCIQKLNFTTVFNYGIQDFFKIIDWTKVSVLMMKLTKKLRSTEDCKHCFWNALNPAFCNNRNWNSNERKICLEMIGKKHDWSEISKKLPKPRTEFQIFYKWKKSWEKKKKFTWKNGMDVILLKSIKEYRSDWVKTTASIGDQLINTQIARDRFFKSRNPMLRFGKITRAEDVLLLLNIELLKGHLELEQHFGIMTAFLPWRYESSWRERAENLFNEFMVPWTIEEDTKLISLAGSSRNDWSMICKQFEHFRNRKSCLTRYRILRKQLVKYKTLANYHKVYAVSRHNVREFRHLQDCVELLRNVAKIKAVPFEGLVETRPPTEIELENLLISFDRVVMKKCIESLDCWIKSRNEHWFNWRQEVMNKNAIASVRNKTTKRKKGVKLYK